MASDTIEDSFIPNIWITIQPDDQIIITSGKSEMGQGVWTSLPMIIAEEMDLDWSKIIIEKAPTDQKKYGSQMTGGSNSVSSGWKKLREAGAVAREMLVMAATQEWDVSPNECKTHNGIVTHERTGRKLSYGDLAKKASQLKVPKKRLNSYIGNVCGNSSSTSTEARIVFKGETVLRSFPSRNSIL